MHENNVWSQWFGLTEKWQREGLPVSLINEYIIHRTERPKHSLHKQPETASEFPRHLPRLQSNFQGSAERLLDMIIGTTEVSPAALTNNTTRSGLVVPPTYSGTRKSSAPQGKEDLSDMSEGKMALWLREQPYPADECPFWMGKVVAINREARQLHVSWYGTKHKAAWREATWLPWFNVLTPQAFQAMSAKDQKKYKTQIGKSCLPSEDIMDLDASQIFFYNFSLRNNGMLAKNTITAIEKQLTAEQLF